MSTIIGGQRKYRIATSILVCLPDMVKSSVRLLGITRAELIEEVIKDGWGGQLDNFQADLSFDGRCRIRLCTREIKVGAKQVNGTILEGDANDVAREFLGRHEVECGETILLPVAIHQVLMTLWQFNIILYAQGSNHRWVQGDKTCKNQGSTGHKQTGSASCNNWRLAHLELAKEWPNWRRLSCHLPAYQHCRETIKWLGW